MSHLSLHTSYDPAYSVVDVGLSSWARMVTRTSCCPFSALSALGALSCADMPRTLVTSRNSCEVFTQDGPLGLKFHLCNGAPVVLEALRAPSREFPKPLLTLLLPKCGLCNIGDAWYDGLAFRLCTGV